MTTIAPHDHLVLPPEPGPWWWACSAPERPHDSWALYDHDCQACTVARQALAVREPDVFMDLRDPDTGEWLRNTTPQMLHEEG